MPHLKQFLICGLLLTIYFLKSINATEPSPSQPPDNDDDDGNPTIDVGKRLLKAFHPMMQNAFGEFVRGFLGKPTVNNQVLSLNLTNMLILMAIKGILWSAAYLGAKDVDSGQGSGAYYKIHQQQRRKIDQEEFVSPTDISFLLHYLQGHQNGGNFDCLYRAVCENPRVANQYVNLIKTMASSLYRHEKLILYSTHNYEIYENAFITRRNDINENQSSTNSFQNLLYPLEKAASDGILNSDHCKSQYRCDSSNEVFFGSETTPSTQNSS